MKRAALVATIAVGLGASSSTRAQPIPLPSPSGSSFVDCAQHTVSYVVAPGARDGDGTAAHPFGSFGAALSLAAKLKACGVNIAAERGEYVESITTQVRNVSIKSHTGGRPLLRGSITHTGGGFLGLTSIDIVGASRVAIRKIGGQASLLSVRVSDTVAVANEIDTGIGLWVSGAAEVVVRMSVFHHNAHNAIRAEGAGTRLWMSGTSVTNTGVNPLVRARIASSPSAPNMDVGAVLVTRDASAWLSSIAVVDSETAGIDVAERAKARLDRVVVLRTTGSGAQGVSAHNGAIVDAYLVNVADSATCGLAVAGASMTSNQGVISKAPVGACVTRPQMSTRCLQRGTKYVDVGVPVTAETYALPSVEDTEVSCTTIDAKPFPSWQ